MSVDEHFGHVCRRGPTSDIATASGGDDSNPFETPMQQTGSRLVTADGIGHRHEQINTTTIYAHLSTMKRRKEITRYLQGGE